MLSGGPCALPLQMSADILKNMGVLTSNPTGSWTPLHVTFYLLVCGHEKYSCFRSLSLLAQWSPLLMAFPPVRKRWFSFQTSVNTIQLDETQRSSAYLRVGDSQGNKIATKWWHNFYIDLSHHGVKLWFFLDRDTFWNKYVPKTNWARYFILDTYVGYLDFINLNAALRSCWLYVNTE